jgi:hypothetical protein
MTLELLDEETLRRESTSYMFGRDSFYDGYCARAYDPYEHARDLGLPIVYRGDLDDDMDACYSEEHQAIFVRPNLAISVERCAIAHEIVHHEHADVGEDREHERRADRIAARRLVRPSAVYELAEVTEDPARMALSLDVTEHIMEVFLRTYGDRV